MTGAYETLVQLNELLTPNMRRVVLGGPGLQHFPPDQESGYIKLMVPSDGDEAQQRAPVARSFTIRAYDPEHTTLTLQAVDHGDLGPASTWLHRAAPGDVVTIRGPGARKLADPRADWFLFAGDMSALPAIAVNLEQLPPDAQGYAFLEVLDAADRQPLRAPPGIEIRWLVNPDADAPNAMLVDAVLGCPWQTGSAYVWFAGEFEAMRRVRRYFRDGRSLEPPQYYVSCYWKHGASDEEMKVAKRADPEA
ncbi:MAG: siderophore-interacting protein [Pseudomonadota bacterium]